MTCNLQLSGGISLFFLFFIRYTHANLHICIYVYVGTPALLHLVGISGRLQSLPLYVHITPKAQYALPFEITINADTHILIYIYTQMHIYMYVLQYAICLHIRISQSIPLSRRGCTITAFCSSKSTANVCG